MICSATGCDLKVGQNGVVVAIGPAEGIVKTVSVIKMIEEEAHVAALSKKVQEFLGVTQSGT